MKPQTQLESTELEGSRVPSSFSLPHTCALLQVSASVSQLGLEWDTSVGSSELTAQELITKEDKKPLPLMLVRKMSEKDQEELGHILMPGPSAMV